MKLHLGCGQRYLDGYVNVDFPSSEHSVQQKSIADLEADILGLQYAPESVQEVRLHHVFEHFPRPVACGLVCGWHSWLRPEGMLHLEVPDFRKTARVMLNPFTSFAKKAVAERHLFGSHEAPWAVHCEGYTAAMLKNMLELFGFEVLRVDNNAWMGTYNLEIFAKKSATSITRDELDEKARTFLANYLVDDGDSEKRLLQVWMKIFRDQLDRCRMENG